MVKITSPLLASVLPVLLSAVLLPGQDFKNPGNGFGDKWGLAPRLISNPAFDTSEPIAPRYFGAHPLLFRRLPSPAPSVGALPGAGLLDPSPGLHPLSLFAGSLYEGSLSAEARSPIPISLGSTEGADEKTDSDPRSGQLEDFLLARPGWDSVSNLPISIGTLWISDAQDGLTRQDVQVKFPILFLFRSPPPIVKIGFAFTELHAGPANGLPRQLFEYTAGMSHVYRISERWTVRSLLGVAWATDHRNHSSDAWQFRGGVFGMYRATESWQWTVGAIALGRDDLPVVPALGAVWQPRPSLRMDLIPPRPRINFLISEGTNRQNWFYLGSSFEGSTWGYRTRGQQDDRLTYGDWRVTAGWRVTPRGEPGVPFVRGRKLNLELGYVFSRDLEFNQEQTTVPLADAWMIRLDTRY
ncbi:MAG: DUF6268 family outer membrane beta-barrel protein [Planctomycetota bacterium]|nr:DUF6268 family outer membrane beta-barrel protein [Planctomycetota bacterium]